MRGARLLIAILLLACLSPAVAARFTPDDLYEYRYVRLANGLDVFLKPRPGAHNVSLRMVVHVGTYDFPCGRKETPHFLEHLLFTGTSKHSENELDSLIEDNGGNWNASTGGEKTIYQIDIFDQYAPLAMNTLYEILTDSQLTQENIDRSRGIIHRESGGEPSALRNWFYRHGLGRSAQDRVDELIWPAEYNCDELESARSIGRQDIVDAWKRYYVPNNMALVVVGNFDSGSMMQRVKSTFGQLAPGKIPKQVSSRVPVVERSTVTGTFSPLLGTEAHVSLNYQARGYESEEVYAIILLNDLLAQEMFRELRVEKGLAYAPTSSIGFDREVGVISLSADSELANVEKVTSDMETLVGRMQTKSISEQELQRVRRRVLLAYAQGYEDNRSIASHYVSLWRRFEKGGRFVDLEQKLQAINHLQLSAAARRLLDPKAVVVAISAPTLTYHRFYALVTVTVLVLVLAVGWYGWRKRGKAAN